MDGGLVRLPPSPERARERRGKKRPALVQVVGVGQHVGQLLVAGAKPVEQLTVCGRLFEVGVRRLLAAVSDDRRGPAMYAAEMPDDVAHRPARTRRDGGIETGR